MSVDAAYQRLREANPVSEPGAMRTNPTDVDIFLAATQLRSAKMETDELAPPEKPGHQRGWHIAAVVALAVVVVGSGLFAFTQRGDDVSAGFADRVAIIEAQARAYSDGDIDEWLTYFAPDASMWDGAYPDSEAVRVSAEAFVAAREEWRFIGACTEQPDLTIVCSTVRRDDFHGPGGLDAVGEMAFAFDAADRITAFGYTSSTNAILAPYDVFDLSFDQWLERTYPVVHANFGDRPYRAMPSTADMPTALHYVAEFVAESDNYPTEDVDVTARAVFDGSACSYEGPVEFTLGSKARFTMLNDSDVLVHLSGLAVWEMPAGITTEQISEVGILTIGEGAVMREVQRRFNADKEADAVLTLDTVGTWAVNCFVLSGPDEGDYPAVVFEVVDR